MRSPFFVPERWAGETVVGAPVLAAHGRRKGGAGTGRPWRRRAVVR